MQVNAWVHRDPRSPPSLESLTLDEPAPDEVVVRVHAAGVCHTDLFAPQVFGLPAVFGHEGAGVVERVGSRVTALAAGDRVMLTFGSCGACRHCVAQAPAYCEHANALQFGGCRGDGTPTLLAPGGPIRGAFFQQSSFATHALATERNAVRIPGDLPFELAAPLGCGVQTGVGAVWNTLAVPPGASVVVFGAGAVGLAAIVAAKLVGADPLIAVDLHPERLALALDFGATHAIDARGDVVGQVFALTGHGADFTLECSGARSAFHAAIDSLGHLGTCGLVTVPDLGAPISFEPIKVLRGGRRLVGVIEGSSVPHRFLPELAELVRDGRLPLARLVRTYPFDELPQALADAAAGRTVKAVLVR